MNFQGQMISSIINIEAHVYLFGSTWEKSLIGKKVSIDHLIFMVPIKFWSQYPLG